MPYLAQCEAITARLRCARPCGESRTLWAGGPPLHRRSHGWRRVLLATSSPGLQPVFLDGFLGHYALPNAGDHRAGRRGAGATAADSCEAPLASHRQVPQEIFEKGPGPGRHLHLGFELGTGVGDQPPPPAIPDLLLAAISASFLQAPLQLALVAGASFLGNFGRAADGVLWDRNAGHRQLGPVPPGPSASDPSPVRLSRVSLPAPPCSSAKLVMTRSSRSAGFMVRMRSWTQFPAGPLATMRYPDRRTPI